MYEYYAAAPYAIEAEASERASFIRRTYAHVAGSVLAFVALEAALLHLPGIDKFVGSLLTSRVSWLLVLLAFIGVSHLANLWARSGASAALQYVGLGLYIVGEAIIFLPLLYIAAFLADPSVIPAAGILTLFLFGGLTLAVFVTRRDFSYLAPILSIGSFLALGLVVAALFIGSLTFSLVIAFLMVALVSGCILYETSNVLYHYRTDQHVAAALALFSSLATLFYYVLYILLATSSRR